MLACSKSIRRWYKHSPKDSRRQLAQNHFQFRPHPNGYLTQQVNGRRVIATMRSGAPPRSLTSFFGRDDTRIFKLSICTSAELPYSRNWLFFKNPSFFVFFGNCRKLLFYQCLVLTPARRVPKLADCCMADRTCQFVSNMWFVKAALPQSMRNKRWPTFFPRLHIFLMLLYFPTG